MRTRAYARYSSDNQRDASLDDQLRNCRNHCERQGWPMPTIYTDAATSGARNDRPGYLKMMRELEPGDVLLVDDLSRLSRDSITTAKAVRRITFAGVRLIGVSDGVDTARKSHKADVGLRGLMSELYLDDLAEKTHRGLTGRALAGKSAGGLAYGYRVTSTGERAIDDDQAAVVHRIYRDYLSGISPRRIAATLNQEGVPSARGSTWTVTAIYGDTKRGIGILANSLYIGRQIWNRSHWIKHPDTGRRIRRERPENEWVINHHPELAIIDQDTWDAVQDRMQRRSSAAAGAGNRHQGRRPRHLLTGILRCATCGGPMVIVNRYSYGCTRHKNRGDAACPSRLTVPRIAVEQALLAGVRDDLMSEAAFGIYQSAVHAALAEATPDTSSLERDLADANRERDNIVKALRAGIITPSTKAELIAAEAAVSDAQDALQAARAAQPATMIPRLRDQWRRTVATLRGARDIPALRDALRDAIGDSVTVHTNENGDLYAEIAASKIDLVAGARCGLYLAEPVRVPILLPGRE